MKLVMKMPLAMFMIKARAGNTRYDKPHGPSNRIWAETSQKGQLYAARLKGKEVATAGGGPAHS